MGEMSNIYMTRYWAEVNLDHLAYNFAQVKKRIPQHQLNCVIKGDAYGHGAVQVANVLSSAGADYFSVALPEEALQLRRHGIKTPILLLGMIAPEWVLLMREHQITVTIGDLAAAKEYAAVLGAGEPLKVHICLDTGMNRIGLKPEEAVAQIAEICQYPCFVVEGIWTHFPAVDDENERDFTLGQIAAYHHVLDGLQSQGITIPLRHFANSDAIATLSPEQYGRTNMARPGLILFGTPNYSKQGIDLKPVLSLRARIMKVHKVKKGESVSYARTWYAERDSLIATIGVGYGDGYFRSLSNRSYALVHGQKAPQVGRVAMDQMMLDITDIPGVKARDIATIVGNDGDETIYTRNHTSVIGTGTSEFLPAIGKRVPRIYYQNGEIVESMCALDLL